MNSEPGEYVLGTDQAELQRLHFQHKAWSAAAFSLWERGGIGPGQRVLDVGSGPGYAALDLARLVAPGGSVLAVDASERFLAALQQERLRLGLAIDTRVQDVQQLDVEHQAFHFAYARWVLCFVRRPEAVVAGVARALRRGGVFAVQDYLHYRGMRLCPRGAAMERVVEAVDASWRADGGDPEICVRLPALLEQHGLRVREIAPLTRCARPGSLLWQWPHSFFAIFLPRLVERGQLTADEVDAFWREWHERSETPGAFFATPPMVEILAVKN